MMKNHIQVMLLALAWLLASCGGGQKSGATGGGQPVEAEVVAEVTGHDLEKDAFTLHVPENWVVVYDASNSVVLQKAGKQNNQNTPGQIGIQKASTIDSLTPEEAISAYIGNSDERVKQQPDVEIAGQVFKCCKEPETEDHSELILMGALPNKRRVEVRLLNLSLDDPSVQEVLRTLKLR